MKKTEKAFDCVHLMRTLRDALGKQMEGLSFEEQKKFIEDRRRARQERRAEAK